MGQHIDFACLSFRDVIKIFLDVLSVLDESQKAGLLYPDVSFENIVYINEEGANRGVLIDWESACSNPSAQTGGYKHNYCSLNVRNLFIVFFSC